MSAYRPPGEHRERTRRRVARAASASRSVVVALAVTCWCVAVMGTSCAGPTVTFAVTLHRNVQ